MSYLLDTNVLLRSVQTSHAMHSDAVNATALLVRDEVVSIVPQNLIEFWAVATRPESNNGLGLTVGETVQRLAFLKSAFSLLPETPEIIQEWEQLVVRHQVLGKQVYDARLVAAMNVHGLTHLLTFNVGDFKRFTGITAVTPQAIIDNES